MSSFWSGWIIIITLVNILGCVWLIWFASKPKAGEAAKGDVTGHTWDDDLEEFNNPLPRWWLWLFYITIVFGFIYIAICPGFGSYAGTTGWTQTNQYEAEMKQAKEQYGPIFNKFASTDIAALTKDTKAMDSGRRLFLNYCSTCHGSDARGAVGFPNLADNDWLYGGTPNAIKSTILDGRMGVMPAFGAALGDKGVEQVANYVMSLSGRQTDAAKAEAGKALFETNCAACHMPDGTGNQMIGAPDLTDKTWLYGSPKSVIMKTIRDGRTGQMPAHRDFLGEDKVHVLAAYIYGLSNK